jgi:quercetin dioxygenase-like cupin family protein
MKRLLSTVTLMACRLSHAASQIPPDALLDRAHSLLRGLHSNQLHPFFREWPSPSDSRSVEAAVVPVLRWLPQLQRSAPLFSAPLVDALAESARSLAWHRSYSAATAGADFYENYGWTEFAGLTGPVPSEHLACGVLLLGPHVTYPSHRHEADEIYVPLVGLARWKHGHDSWRQRPPGSVIHHARHESHAMQTNTEPLLALYLWRSQNLGQSSQLDYPLSTS